jgi:hypothetical protein
MLWSDSKNVVDENARPAGFPRCVVAVFDVTLFLLRVSDESRYDDACVAKY